MIADSKEVKDWDLQINLEPDQIEAKVLKRPGILTFTGPQPVGAPVSGSGATSPSSATSQSLEDTNVLRQIVCQPVNF